MFGEGVFLWMIDGSIRDDRRSRVQPDHPAVRASDRLVKRQAVIARASFSSTSKVARAGGRVLVQEVIDGDVGKERSHGQVHAVGSTRQESARRAPGIPRAMDRACSMVESWSPLPPMTRVGHLILGQQQSSVVGQDGPELTKDPEVGPGAGLTKGPGLVEQRLPLFPQSLRLTTRPSHAVRSAFSSRARPAKPLPRTYWVNESAVGGGRRAARRPRSACPKVAANTRERTREGCRAAMCWAIISTHRRAHHVHLLQAERIEELDRLLGHLSGGVGRPGDGWSDRLPDCQRPPPCVPGAPGGEYSEGKALQGCAQTHDADQRRPLALNRVVEPGAAELRVGHGGWPGLGRVRRSRLDHETPHDGSARGPWRSCYPPPACRARSPQR